MEELQLTLTPSRVDQRNQGIMLANWRVGQTINALVSDRMPNGGVLLTVGSQSFVTSRDIPVQQGSRVQLEIQQMEPRLVLRLVNIPSSVAARQAPDIFVNGTPLNAAQSQASGLSSLYRSLGINLQGTTFNISEMKALLANNFLTPGSINTNSLQTAMALSGIFTEALWLSNRASLGAQSTKTLLMILRQRIALALESSGLSSSERSALTRLINSVDSSISSITYQQISSLPQQSGGSKWLATLPLQLGDEVCEIDVEIERGPRQESDDDGEWKFSFSLTLERLGPLTVSIELVNGRLRIDFAVTAVVIGRLGESLPLLRDRLLAADLELEQLSSSALEPNSDGVSGSPKVSLDISA